MGCGFVSDSTAHNSNSCRMRHHLQWAAVDVVVVYVLLRHGMTNAHAHSWKDQPTTRVLWGGWEWCYWGVYGTSPLASVGIAACAALGTQNADCTATLASTAQLAV